MNSTAKTIHALVSLSLETPPHVATVFVQLDAHIEAVSVRIHCGGWRRDESANFSANAYYTGPLALHRDGCLVPFDKIESEVREYLTFCHALFVARSGKHPIAPAAESVLEVASVA